ncbi:MAG: T9SS C-terminal target domain-containing protein [Candidatus Zixiibacteriota bacterium]|nr:MAG: T9SS C-terminal target domain-containing protein [candidate division Zixibacteria bacterium]
MEAGSHKVIFDGSGLPSGVYLLRLEAGDFTRVQKLVLLK